jgi:hypothetical protein
MAAKLDCPYPKKKELDRRKPDPSAPGRYVTSPGPSVRLG